VQSEKAKLVPKSIGRDTQLITTHLITSRAQYQAGALRAGTSDLCYFLYYNQQNSRISSFCKASGEHIV
jgi:hypothetical protein